MHVKEKKLFPFHFTTIIIYSLTTVIMKIMYKQSSVNNNTFRKEKCK